MGAGCLRIPENQLHKSLPIRHQTNSPRRQPKKTHNENSVNGRRRSAFWRRDEFVEASAGEIIQNAVKTPEDTQKILAALNSHFIFTSLTDEDKEMVANAMQLYTFQSESYIFMQGMPSKSYYVIRTGSIDVYVNNKRVNKIRPGDGFGELALLHDNPRSASLKCTEATSLWGLDRETFKKVIEEMNMQIYEQNRAFLEKVSLLDALTPQQKDVLAASLISHKYFSGQKIITEGETGNQLFFLKEGIVSLIKGTQEIKRFYPGSYFGEGALITNTPRTATCIAVDGPVKCMCLTREILQKALNNKLQDIIEKNTINEAIKKSPKLSALNREQKENIVKTIAEKAFKAGDVVISVGTSMAQKMYFVMSGRLQFAKNSVLFCDKGNAIGDSHVTRSSNEEMKYEDDLIAGCDMKIGEITKYQLEMAIGGKYEEVIKKNAASNVLRKILIFSSIEYSKMKDLFNIILIEKFSDSEIILREGVMGQSVHIIKRGKVDVFKAGTLIKSIRRLGFFGERSLVLGQPSACTYVASGHTTIWKVKLEHLQELMNDRMKEQLLQRIRMQDEDTELSSLLVLQKVGSGSTAKVYLVKTPQGEKYALKAVSRKKIEKYGLHQQLIVFVI
jgi:cGMP-dependent protein kinase 1